MSTRQRQEFLVDFFSADLPSDKEGEMYWVKPSSPDRLMKMANHIAECAQVRLEKEPTIYKSAIEKWTRDLEFLKVHVYEVRGFSFEWPVVARALKRTAGRIGPSLTRAWGRPRSRPFSRLRKPHRIGHGLAARAARSGAKTARPGTDGGGSTARSGARVRIATRRRPAEFG